MNNPGKFSLCTLCLNKESNLLDVLEYKEAGLELSVVIQEVLQVTIPQERGMAWKICFICMRKLHDFHNFKNQAIKCKDLWEYFHLKSKQRLDNFSEVDSQAPDSCSEGGGCLSILSCDEDVEDDFTLLLESDSEDGIASVGCGVVDEAFEGSYSDGNDLSVKEESDDMKQGIHLEKNPLETVECSGPSVCDIKCNNEPDEPELQFGVTIAGEVLAEEPDEQTPSTVVRRSQRERRCTGQSALGHLVMENDRRRRSKLPTAQKSVLPQKSPKRKTCVSDPITVDEVLVVGRKRRTSVRLKAKNVDTNKGTRSRCTSGCDDELGKQRTKRAAQDEKKDVEPPDGRRSRKKRQSVASKAPMTDEVHQKKLERRREYYRKYYWSMCEEKKRDHIRQMCERNKRRWDSKSKEEQREIRKRRYESRQKRIALKSDGEKEEWRRKRHEWQHKYRASMSEERRLAYLQQKRGYYQKRKTAIQIKVSFSSTGDPVN